MTRGSFSNINKFKLKAFCRPVARETTLIFFFLILSIPNTFAAERKENPLLAQRVEGCAAAVQEGSRAAFHWDRHGFVIDGKRLKIYRGTPDQQDYAIWQLDHTDRIIEAGFSSVFSRHSLGQLALGPHVNAWVAWSFAADHKMKIWNPSFPDVPSVLPIPRDWLNIGPASAFSTVFDHGRPTLVAVGYLDGLIGIFEPASQKWIKFFAVPGNMGVSFLQLEMGAIPDRWTLHARLENGKSRFYAGRVEFVGDSNSGDLVYRFEEVSEDRYYEIRGD